MNPFDRIPIVHIASMARSGETVLLRALAAHSRIHIVHNLEQRDELHSARLFEHLKSYSKTRISRRHSLVQPYSPKRGDVLVVKQGVWEHRYPFNGIILSRNPIAIYASLRTYDAPSDTSGSVDLDDLWHHNTQRLTRWMRDIDKDLVTSIEQSSPINQFCLFYNRRMGALLELGLPIINYENLVTDPRHTLNQVTSEMGLPFDESMLLSHTSYSGGTEGHGKADMSQPLNNASLKKYTQVLTKAEFSHISDACAHVASRYGYKLEWDRIVWERSNA